MLKRKSNSTKGQVKPLITTSRTRPRREQPARLTPIDGKGRPIRAGDWVRLVTIPPAVRRAPRETRAVFRNALGKTFRVEAFDHYGHVELDVSKKVAKLNWIWVEPEFLERTRTPSR